MGLDPKPVQFQRLGLTPLGLDHDIRNLPFAIRGAPEINHASIDLEIDLVQMPSSVGPWSTFAQTSSDLRSKVVDPTAHGLTGHDDPAFSQQIFDVSEAQSEPDIQPDRLLNDHGRKAVTGVADFGHRGR